MMGRNLLFCLLFAASSAHMYGGDLKAVMAEPNLERRSEKAAKNADVAMNEARDALKAGNFDKVKSALDEIRESVDLTKKSLDDSGKKPRNSSKYFKRAEINLRNLIRRLDTFRVENSVEDREPIDALIRHVQQVREEILQGIMRK